jgi:hypothetical protein
MDRLREHRRDGSLSQGGGRPSRDPFTDLVWVAGDRDRAVHAHDLQVDDVFLDDVVVDVALELGAAVLEHQAAKPRLDGIRHQLGLVVGEGVEGAALVVHDLPHRCADDRRQHQDHGDGDLKLEGAEERHAGD